MLKLELSSFSVIVCPTVNSPPPPGPPDSPSSSALTTRFPRAKGEEETEREAVEKLAGVVPVPVAAMMEGSAWRRSHSMVWPSDLWPSSLVSWKTRAAHMIGMRILLPLPSTLLCRSLVGGFLTALRGPLLIMTPLVIAPSLFSMESRWGIWFSLSHSQGGEEV